jgi:chorismate lyase/3-hydroxybenzoate synthase
MPAQLEVFSRPRPLRVFFGERTNEKPSEVVGLTLNLPWLAGAPCEEIFDHVVPLGAEDGIDLYRSDDLLIGHASTPFEGADLSGAAQRLYERVLTACRGRHLYRIWNYVPRINEDTAGLENYRAFCRGRSVAFEKNFGGSYQQKLSSASAVGCEGSILETLFVAGKSVPTHIENPEQIPAYQYPLEYGPRSPSFSRATTVKDGTRQWVFVSGTAAIKGHHTVSTRTLAEQIDCTLDNLRLVSRASGIGDTLGAGDGWERHFKVYLRRASDLAATTTALERSLLSPVDRVTYLRADICRAALDVEIEATLTKRDKE